MSSIQRCACAETLIDRRLAARMDAQANYFQAASCAAANAGIFHLSRNLDLAQMDEVIGWLEAHWDEMASAKAA